MRSEGDREWLATLLLFGPRWLVGLPLPPLAVAAAIWHRWLLVPLAITALVLLGPFMGFQAHLPAGESSVAGLRLMTLNVDQYALDVDGLAQLVLDQQPDIVALQEVRDAHQYKWPAGWHVVDHHEFLLASRWPVLELGHFRRKSFPFDLAAVCFQVELLDRRIQVFNIHLQSPRQGLQALLDQGDEAGELEFGAILKSRDIESRQVSDFVESFLGPKIVVGDFNMPGESTIFRRDWTPRLSDAFAARGFGFGFTKISGELGFDFGARIDHVLYSEPWRCLRAWVGPSVSSDHLPLFAEFE
jgi:endonuclease/exonuclease/phosphatase (EEP) superfamily protein YafD